MSTGTNTPPGKKEIEEYCFKEQDLCVGKRRNILSPTWLDGLVFRKIINNAYLWENI